MKVVLSQSVDQLGVVGETKDVKPGFARNYLFPRKLAVLAKDPLAKQFRSLMVQAREDRRAQSHKLAQLADQWKGQSFKLTARAADDGTLYGSVSVKDVKKLLGRDDLDFSMPVVKTIGTHGIDLRFNDQVTIPITLVVEPEGRSTTRTK